MSHESKAWGDYCNGMADLIIREAARFGGDVEKSADHFLNNRQLTDFARQKIRDVIRRRPAPEEMSYAINK